MKYHLRSLPLIAMITLGGVNAACSMEFAQHYDGALRMDGNSTRISAEGEITAETPAAFERFLNDAPLIFKRQAIVISSPGGSVVAGIKLGAIIRQHQFLTTVGSSVKSGKSVMEFSISSVAPGECASSCVFAFAGGVERFVAKGSRLGVHQISMDFKDLYKTNVVSVEELDRSFAFSQAAIGLAISHFLGMGIDPSIVPMMVTKDPGEIKWLSSSELSSTKLIYDPTVFDDWAVEPYKAGLVAFTKSADGTRQLTLFCSANRMKFKLTASGGAYAEDFVSSVGAVKEIEVAGMKIAEPNFKISDVKGGMVIIGDWTGTEVKPEERSVFSLFGETTGSMADLFSMYRFNERGFQQGLRLARRNCVS